MTEKRYIGMELHHLDRLIGKRTDMINQKLFGEDMPAAGGWIIGFILRENDKPVYQKDIEQCFCMPPSSVTKLLKQMEKEGYITRTSVESDARLKRIVVTDKAKQIHTNVIRALHKTIEEELLEGFTEEEEAAMFRLLDKLKANVTAARSRPITF